MNRKTRRQIAKAVTIACVAAAFVAPVAQADPPQGHRARVAPPDLIERYVASGRGQADLVERWVDARAGQPDLIERYVATHRPVGFPDGRPDGYDPQLRVSGGAVSAPDNAVRSVPRGTLPVVATETVSSGFDWADAAAGAATGALLSLLASGAIAFARKRRLAHS
jgi:hypothetical protein